MPGDERKTQQYCCTGGGLHRAQARVSGRPVLFQGNLGGRAAQRKHPVGQHLQDLFRIRHRQCSYDELS